MASIHETQPTIQRQLSNNDFIGSLDLISTSQDVLNKDLAGIHSFRSVIMLTRLKQFDFFKNLKQTEPFL